MFCCGVLFHNLRQCATTSVRCRAFIGVAVKPPMPVGCGVVWLLRFAVGFRRAAVLCLVVNYIVAVWLRLWRPFLPCDQCHCPAPGAFTLRRDCLSRGRLAANDLGRVRRPAVWSQWPFGLMATSCFGNVCSWRDSHLMRSSAVSFRHVWSGFILPAVLAVAF